jgi:hypothetical protein
LSNVSGLSPELRCWDWVHDVDHPSSSGAAASVVTLPPKVAAAAVTSVTRERARFRDTIKPPVSLLSRR